MVNVKIVQLVIGPDNNAYQGSLLGLGSDGAVYRAGNDSMWHQYFPSRFSGDNIEAVLAEAPMMT